MGAPLASDHAVGLRGLSLHCQAIRLDDNTLLLPGDISCLNRADGKTDHSSIDLSCAPDISPVLL